MASNELDFVDRWVNLTVEKEVLRGSKLRNEKLRSYSPQDEYEFGNINLVRSTCTQMNMSRYRKRSLGRSKVKKVVCSPRSNSPFIGPKLSKSRGYTHGTVYSKPNTPSIKSKRVLRCPMRIAELAVPTKRQCIDTWRNKYHVLPSFMVERLRQQIMDKKPVVEIKEAISCFKRRYPRSIKSVKRSNIQIIRESKLKNERMDEIRTLCVAFANRIGQRLITPQNLKLTPELGKISKVVTAELTMIVKNRKKFDLDEVSNRIIQADIADKITIWIAMILEDVSKKILEEDLRVKKESDRRIKDERLVTIIPKLLRHNKTTELEEEEGPVLDVIDDLVNNVVAICMQNVMDIEEIDNISETTSKRSGETLDSNITYNTGDDIIHIINDLVPEIDATNQTFEQTMNDYILEELYMIVNSVMPTTDHDNEMKDDIENQTSEHKDLLPEAPGNSELTSFKPVQSDTYLALEDVIESDKNNFEDGTVDSKPEPDIENDSELSFPKPVQSDTDLALEDNTDDIEYLKTENDKMSDVLSDEGSFDDKNKKVKFSEVKMDGDETQPVESTSASQSMGEKGHQRERLSWHSSIDIHDIVFAPPNDHLLSDADELWPDDIVTPILKPSASVNRSITSLGKILEKDEKMQPEDETLRVLDCETMQHTELEIVTHDDVNNSQTNEQLEIVLNLLVHLKADQKTKPDSTHESKPEDVTKETTSSIHTIKTTEEKAMTDKTVEADVTPETKRLIVDSSTSPIKIAIDDDNFKQKQAIVRDKQLTEKDIKNPESDANVIYEADQQKMRSSYAIAEPKHDYKVNANTAPSWLRHDHGKGEPSEDSFPGSKSKEKLKDAEIRNRCKDLDRIYVNLEMWNDWIDSTCKNVLYLKHKREMNKLFELNARRKDARDWITLKKNIDKDAVLWTKLNQKAYERLKFYKGKSKPYQQPAESEVPGKNEDKETILKTLQEIDRLCLWMHRTIVSTEYCLLCDCKNNTKRKV